MIGRWWLGVLLVCLPASVLSARQGSLSTTDGRVMQGDIQESADGQSVTITIHGATFTIERENVASISYAENAARDFHKKLSGLNPNDITGRLELSRAELAARQYDLAAEAARDAERLDPHNPDAVILLDTIESQRVLDAKAVAAAAPAPATEPTSLPATTAASSNPSSGKYLTMEDVYAIRRAELLPDDDVRVTFLNNVRKRYLGSGGDAAAFKAESDTQQALDIIQTGERRLARDVHIETDPRVMAEFRVRIQPRILAGCAAAGCHGGAGAGGFLLYPDTKETLPSYTNFYLMEQMGRKLAGGDMLGGGAVYRPMIDRLHVGSSLLLQFGLAKSLASTPHPKVMGFTPMFRSPEDPKYDEIYRWIGSLNVIAPDYGIKWKLIMDN